MIDPLKEYHSAQTKLVDIVKAPSKARLVFDWRRAWRFWTVQLAFLVGIVNSMSDQIGALLPFLPGDGLKWFNAGMALLIILSRIVAQFAPTSVGTETKVTVETTKVEVDPATVVPPPPAA